MDLFFELMLAGMGILLVILFILIKREFEGEEKANKAIGKVATFFEVIFSIAPLLMYWILK